MPIYHYVCGACSHELEVLQKINDDPLKECPDCGELALRKQVTAAAFRLKGTGWYATDFKNQDKKPKDKQAKPDKGADGKSDASGKQKKKSTADAKRD